ncbi:MAG: S41 family peptidase [Deltaproteobacteria bacterium]|nr:S41 family peptidase [Deltaproteobacteria bacterium]
MGGTFMRVRIHRALILGLLAGPLLFWGRPGHAAPERDELYRDLKLFTDVLSLVRENYVDEVETGRLIQGAINGMLLTLDPHSSFMPPDVYREMQDETRGEFGGIGIEITIRDNVLTIVSPIEDTPADRAGLKAGDQIVKIGDKSTKDMTLVDAVRLMRGEKGTRMVISILRESLAVPKEYTLVREIIRIRSVWSKVLEEGFGYVRIAQFQENTADELRKNLVALQGKGGKALEGLILDLRNDPGGLLDQAVKVADAFLSEGLIVYTEGREAQGRMKFVARNDKNEISCPIVVLINGGSASASEIVAGALQDHRRAVILGTPSFGKGSVQSIIPLGDDNGLRLTTALYFTPSGRSIQAKGIIPDILVHPLQTKEEEGAVFREADLENHLTPTGRKLEESRGDRRGPAAVSEAGKDYQLSRALDLLKGWRLLKGLEKKGAA